MIDDRYNPEQLDRLINEIEGRLNDFESGESDKEETIKSFAELTMKIAMRVSKEELEKILRHWGDSALRDIIEIRIKELNPEPEPIKVRF